MDSTPRASVHRAGRAHSAALHGLETGNVVKSSVTGGRRFTVVRRFALALAVVGFAAIVVPVISRTLAGRIVGGSEPGAAVASPEPVRPAPGGPAVQSSGPAAAPSDFERWYRSQPRENVPVSRDGAAVLIVKFTDYQCPACAQTYFGYRSVLAKYEAQHPGAVRLVSLDYPLNIDCNPGLPRTLHPMACEAAVAMALAARNHRAAPLEEWLYANQQVLTPLLVRRAAGTLGGVTDWQAAAPSALETVKANAALGRVLHVESTPTFFINGVRVTTLPPPGSFDAAIRYELERAGRPR
jgi:protein-disulfide isomerase